MILISKPVRGTGTRCRFRILYIEGGRLRLWAGLPLGMRLHSLGTVAGARLRFQGTETEVRVLGASQKASYVLAKASAAKRTTATRGPLGVS